MNKELIRLALTLLSGLAYAILFAGSSSGINVFIFGLLFAAIGWWQFPAARARIEVQLLLVSTVLSALLYCWHHSFLALITHQLTLLLYIGCLQAEAVRFVYFTFLLGIASVFEIPRMAIQQFKNILPSQSALRSIGSWVPFIVLPVLLSLLFGGIYYQANPNFARAVDFLSPSLNWVDLFHSGFFWNSLAGMALTTALLGTSIWAQRLSAIEKNMPNDLQRGNKRRAGSSSSILGLKRAYWAAISTLVTLNVLIFSANLADLRYVWFDYGNASPQELSQYVHSGTSLLIIAILLAMGVILWYFRGNLNFYPDKGLLKLMAYIWIAQNAMLALSVGLRNWQYVQQYGLAPLRLGVFWFLMLVGFGLLSMFLKVKHEKSIYYLLRQNGWAFFISMLVASSINWDNWITRYNLQANTQTLDTHFLLYRISDKNIALLWKYQDQITEKSDLEAARVEELLMRKQQHFLNRLGRQDWRGWNVIDTWNYNTLKKMGTL